MPWRTSLAAIWQTFASALALALLASAPLRRQDFLSDGIMLFVTAAMVFGLLHVRADGALPWLSIVPLSICLACYFWTLKGREADEVDDEDVTFVGLSLGWGVLYFLLGVAGLYVGGELMVSTAVVAARQLAVGADVIALTIVAFGTSIPDITASVVAARRGEHGIAAGNLLGSNISNITLVLNATLLGYGGPLASTFAVRMDYLAVSVISLVVLGLIFKLERVTKTMGWILIASYLGYLILRIM